MRSTMRLMVGCLTVFPLLATAIASDQQPSSTAITPRMIEPASIELGDPAAVGDRCDYSNCCRCDDGCHIRGIFGPCSFHGSHRACYDHEQRHALADKHAPAGLMGDHLHDTGEWMFEYKYMSMYMDGNQAGTRNLPDRQVFGFAGTNMGATPTNMTMEMHMIHIMYGWKENVTLYIMPMLTSLTMDHLRGPNTPNPPGAFSSFTTHNSGFDDLAMGALWRIHEGCDDELILNLGFSVPTGDLDRQTTAPMGIPTELPYPMRRGSGTFDVRPGITYKRYYNWGSVGLQYQGDLPLGRNKENYAVSKEHRLNAWATWLPCDRFALSGRVEGLFKSNFVGADPELNPAVISTARPDMRGGDWINLGYGASTLVANGYLLSFEAIHPIYEYLNGIQLSNDWWMFASVSKAF